MQSRQSSIIATACLAFAFLYTGCSGDTDNGSGMNKGPCSNEGVNPCDCPGDVEGFRVCDEGSTFYGQCNCSGSDTSVDLVADQYVAGLEKVTESKRFSVKLIKSDPLPKYVGKYVWTLQLLDADSKPVTDAKLEAEARMPQHAHGTFPPISYAAETAEKGTYLLETMDLFMSGIWQVHLRFTAGGEKDEVFYNIDLEG